MKLIVPKKSDYDVSLIEKAGADPRFLVESEEFSWHVLVPAKFMIDPQAPEKYKNTPMGFLITLSHRNNLLGQKQLIYLGRDRMPEVRAAITQFCVEHLGVSHIEYTNNEERFIVPRPEIMNAAFIALARAAMRWQMPENETQDYLKLSDQQWHSFASGAYEDIKPDEKLYRHIWFHVRTDAWQRLKWEGVRDMKIIEDA